jgi:PPM family protein phosphatase
MSYRYLFISKTGLHRDKNEDAVAVFPLESGLLIILCDGLGGNRGGEVASSLSVETVHETFINSNEDDYLERIRKSVRSAHDLLLDHSGIHFDLKGMATTIEVLYLNNTHAYWAHVGDSRIYHLKNGKLKQITKDHSLVQKLVDEGYLTLKEAENHPNKNIIMRAIGDNQDVEIDLSKIKINEGDSSKFFICSDGVTAVIKDYEIENLLNLYPIEDASEKFIKVIEERGAPDNYTFVIAEKKR